MPENKTSQRDMRDLDARVIQLKAFVDANPYFENIRAVMNITHDDYQSVIGWRDKVGKEKEQTYENVRKLYLEIVDKSAKYRGHPRSTYWVLTALIEGRYNLLVKDAFDALCPSKDIDAACYELELAEYLKDAAIKMLATAPQEQLHIVSSISTLPQSKLARLQYVIDQNNLYFFPALFDAGAHRKRGHLQSALRPEEYMILALLLPLTSAIYVLSRLVLIVFNPTAYVHNPAKASLMLAATLATTGIMASLAMFTSALTPATMLFVSGAMDSAIAGGIIVGVLAMIAVATLLHLSKNMAKMHNAETIVHPSAGTVKVTAPKHQLNTGRLVSPGGAITVQHSVLPLFDQCQAEVVFQYHLPNNENYRVYKPVLTLFESIAKANKKAEVSSDMLDDLKNKVDLLPRGGLPSVKQDLARVSVMKGRMVS